MHPTLWGKARKLPSHCNDASNEVIQKNREKDFERLAGPGNAPCPSRDLTFAQVAHGFAPNLMRNHEVRLRRDLGPAFPRASFRRAARLEREEWSLIARVTSIGGELFSLEQGVDTRSRTMLSFTLSLWQHGSVVRRRTTAAQENFRCRLCIHKFLAPILASLPKIGFIHFKEAKDTDPGMQRIWNPFFIFFDSLKSRSARSAPAVLSRPLHRLILPDLYCAVRCAGSKAETLDVLILEVSPNLPWARYSAQRPYRRTALLSSVPNILDIVFENS
ncbi:uncharacterized protein FOMMEDRAFT_150717 [Fomitiporia mediterranea MF3/22]|uniref:uncharacterized protein n=1 Tax=Fomitiporia mediterranea (strain MF3/22) TaxID=694068 RepID=UPI0004409310|nr:uncharacterized protein FOMMEDRAFT_150717 [Fomitiporia mediterranea MF3/22]EJD08048.1 hypothetical protein FOMMEDRAFT_150717 [Fomitiporia mediterranea MF3/22]